MQIAVLAPAPANEAWALDPSAVQSFSDWIAIGRNLANQKRNLDWLIGDWITIGKEKFPEQFELALTTVSDDAKAMRRIEAITQAFPPHKRDCALSFDHHAHVADLPPAEAMAMLKAAKEGKWSAKRLRIEAMTRKIEIGQIQIWEDDAETIALRNIAVAWNRAPIAVREEFADMIDEVGTGDVDA